MEQERPKNYDDLPLVLNMMDIQKILGISRTTAYQLVHEDGFPAFRSGNRIKISKEALFQWMAKGRA
ncbi:MAG: helix-turn-helix domain-containing protein [Lachnospiraceae bacterium]|nr:helix-turn-helix domain-containing protein [Lachnospiraceae bacterium]